MTPHRIANIEPERLEREVYLELFFQYRFNFALARWAQWHL